MQVKSLTAFSGRQSMNFKGNYIQIGTVDISRFREMVGTLSEEDWNRNAWRQQAYETHKATQTIALIFDEDFRHENPTVLPGFHRFEPVLRPVMRIISAHYNKSVKAQRLYRKHGPGYFVRMNLVRLSPGGEIPEHLDRNYSLTHGHRIHLPVVTNDKADFIVGGERINMKEGEIWEINNRHVHSVVNRGDEGRVHLILDWVVPGEPCCCGRRLHPRVPCSPEACNETDHALLPCSCYD